jgi:hypothetical protein
MSLKRRILVNGLMAAIPLAVIGFLFAQMAGLWAASQDARAAETGAAITDSLVQRLPLTMAMGGFAFVLFGELLLALWRRPTHNPK